MNNQGSDVLKKDRYDATQDQPSYRMGVNVDVTDTDYIVPANFSILELRCNSEGTIKVRLADRSDNVINLYSGGFDVFRLNIIKVYRLGTDLALRTGAITLFGFHQ
jgi:hypothetical protein